MNDTAAKRTGPVIIAYDGTEAAGHAVREAAALLAGQPALVLTVWKEGMGFELVESPSLTGLAPAPIDVNTALEVDEAEKQRAQRTAQQGAALAADAGFASADGLAVADEVDISVAETIGEVARKRDAQAIVVGAHSQGRLAAVVVGSTSRDVIRIAPCPVVVVRETPTD